MEWKYLKKKKGRKWAGGRSEFWANLINGNRRLIKRGRICQCFYLVMENVKGNGIMSEKLLKIK